MQKVFIFLASIFLAVTAVAQPTPPSGGNWQRVQQVKLRTHIHVSADKMSRTCFLDSVDEDKLTCSGGIAGHYIFPRAEIKSIKVTRYALSTLGGAGIGAGVGFLVGVGVAHQPQTAFTVIGNGAVRLVFTVIGAVPGALVGGFTDMFRGPTIYRRM